MAAPLTGLRVLDCSARIAGPYTARLLADLGADVIKVEGMRGDPARQMGPFVTAEPNPDGSALFLYLNGNKRGLIFDPGHDRELLRELIRQSDILIQDGPGDLFGDRQFNAGALARLNPALVCTRVSPFGESGPYSHWSATELVLCALSGMMHMTGERAGMPVKMGGYQAQYTAGAAAAVATLAAARFSRMSGHGQQIEVSLLEPVLNSVHQQTARYAYWGAIAARSWWPGGPNLYEVGDGWVFAPFGRPRVEVVEALGLPEELQDARYLELDELDDSEQKARIAEYRDKVLAWFRTQDKTSLCNRAQEAGVTWAPVNDEVDLLDCPQMAAREVLAEVEHPVAGRYRYPRRSFVSPQLEWAPASPAPVFKDDRATRSTGWLPREPVKTTASNAKRPLEGIRILTPEHWAALPHGTKYLAALGAEVFSIERADATHRGRDPLYNEGFRQKYQASLDLSKPEGVELFKRLAATADVVADNFSPRVMARLGLDEKSLRAVKPDLIVLTVSGFGHAGERLSWKGHTVTAESACGLNAATGFPEGPPIRPGGTPHGDIVTGLTAAFSVLVALEHRDRTNEGVRIDLGMIEPNTLQLGERLLSASVTGGRIGRLGNRDPNAAPSGCYPCAGEDQWVTIAIEKDDEWRELVALVGSDRLDATMTMQDRLHQQDDIDAALADWTRGQDKLAVMNACQTKGIAAGAVLNVCEVLTNEHILSRGTFEVVNNLALGEKRLHLGPPYRLSRTPASTDEPASPSLGFHNEAVYCGALGLSKEELDELVEAGVIGYAAEARDGEEDRLRPEFGLADADFKIKLGL